MGSPSLGGGSFLWIRAGAGKWTVKTEPLPGSLVTVTSPPIVRASLRAMARPRPVPPKRPSGEGPKRIVSYLEWAAIAHPRAYLGSHHANAGRACN